MKKIFLVCVALFALSVSAQVRVLAPGQQPDTNSPQLSIMFNYNESPSRLLIESANYRRLALNTTIIGGAASGLLFCLGGKQAQQTVSGDSPLPTLGAITAIATGITALILEYISISKERQAGEQLKRITISAGGVSYHF